MTVCVESLGGICGEGFTFCDVTTTESTRVTFACHNTRDTGFHLPGTGSTVATCRDLVDYCDHPAYGARIRGLCPRACQICPDQVEEREAAAAAAAKAAASSTFTTEGIYITEALTTAAQTFRTNPEARVTVAAQTGPDTAAASLLCRVPCDYGSGPCRDILASGKVVCDMWTEPPSILTAGKCAGSQVPCASEITIVDPRHTAGAVTLPVVTQRPTEAIASASPSTPFLTTFKTTTATTTVTTTSLVCHNIYRWKTLASNEGCAKFVQGEFCTADGKTGPGWDDEWGTIEEWTGANGKTALDACCGCGGGKWIRASSGTAPATTLVPPHTTPPPTKMVTAATMATTSVPMVTVPGGQVLRLSGLRYSMGGGYSAHELIAGEGINCVYTETDRHSHERPVYCCNSKSVPLFLWYIPGEAEGYHGSALWAVGTEKNIGSVYGYAFLPDPAGSSQSPAMISPQNWYYFKYDTGKPVQIEEPDKHGIIREVLPEIADPGIADPKKPTSTGSDGGSSGGGTAVVVLACLVVLVGIGLVVRRRRVANSLGSPGRPGEGVRESFLSGVDSESDDNFERDQFMPFGDVMA